MENEELIRRATDLHEETQETEKQISIIDEQIRELENYKSHVNSLKNVSDQNVLSSIGKGIHVKTRFESPEIFIEVGAGVVIKKTVEETISIIEEQLSKFKQARIQLMQRLQTLTTELGTMISILDQLRKSRK